jgi:hypothetical protein
MKVEFTDQERDKAGQIVEATWADFMQHQNTPFYRPTAELWAAMACMALSGIACERKEQEVKQKAAVEEEREACARIAEEKVNILHNTAERIFRLKKPDEIARQIRARSSR